MIVGIAGVFLLLIVVALFEGGGSQSPEAATVESGAAKVGTEGGSQTLEATTVEPKARTFERDRWNPKHDEDGEELAQEGRIGDWYGYAVIDTFEGGADRWFATTRTGDYAEVRYSCANGEKPEMRAFAEHAMPTMRTLGSSFSCEVQNDCHIRVSYKVDDGEVVKTSGEYPHRISEPYAVDSDFSPIWGAPVSKMARMFSEGREARIRTSHGDEQHTFIVSLDGFAETSKWVDGKCGFERLDTE